MPVKSIRIDKETDPSPVIEINIGGKAVSVPYSAIAGTRLEQETMLIELLQTGIDFRQRRNQIPHDDLDRNTDPNRENFFHDGQWLVSREVIVVAAPWDGEKFLLELRKAQDIPRT